MWLRNHIDSNQAAGVAILSIPSRAIGFMLYLIFSRRKEFDVVVHGVSAVSRWSSLGELIIKFSKVNLQSNPNIVELTM
jgi:hypothetical protein